MMIFPIKNHFFCGTPFQTPNFPMFGPVTSSPFGITEAKAFLESHPYVKGFECGAWIIWIGFDGTHSRTRFACGFVILYWLVVWNINFIFHNIWDNTSH